MLKACIVVDEFYQKNKLFDLNNTFVNRDNCMYFFYAVKREFYKNGIDLSTQDINSVAESEIVIYNDMPDILPNEKDIKKSYLLIFETDLVKSDNWDFKKHKKFNKIFTWKDKLIDNKKYFKFNFSHKIPEINKFDLSKKSRFCTLIGSNKKSNHHLELYSKREEAISWFEKNHLEDFDLYGMGWNKKTYMGRFKFLNRFESLRKFRAKKHSSYKGKVDSKYEVLQEYKFSICYENARDISGYITEKIFDCFFAGCVPIYWGASNISDYIPENCYIDKTQFDGYEKLYNYLKNMSDKEYRKYIENIEKYLKSDRIDIFSAEFIAKKITSEILS